MLISKLIKAKPNSRYLIGYLDKAIRPLALIMSRCVKTFKVKDNDKDKNKKLISFCIDDEKLLKNIN